MAQSIQRIIQALTTLFLASIVIFLVLRLIPGDPALLIVGPSAGIDEVEAVRERMGLDRPLPQQYIQWLEGILHLDLGRSYISNFPVKTLIMSRVLPTLELTFVTLLVILVVSIPLGVYSAIRAGRPFDTLVTAISSLAIGIPNFWLGILLILVLAVQLQWLPASGRFDPSLGVWLWLKSIALPVSSLAFYHSAVLTRFVRTSFLDVIAKDYVRTAHAKGLKARTVTWKHTMRNALVPIVTVLGITVGRMLGGSVIVESVFSWPGVGQLVVQAVLNRDYLVVQGCLLLFIAAFIVINLAVDLLYSVIDVRTATSAQSGSRA